MLDAVDSAAGECLCVGVERTRAAAHTRRCVEHTRAASHTRVPSQGSAGGSRSKRPCSLGPQTYSPPVCGACAASANVRIFRIDGSVPAIERQGLVNAFQALPPGMPAIFLLSILAAGQGLTLTGASTAVFGELRWTPGELLQAEDRW